MKRFVTSYPVADGRSFSGEIMAATEAEAELYAAWRGLGERIDLVTTSPGNVLGLAQLLAAWPEDEETSGAMAAALHEACFLCFVGLKAGVLSPEETLGDLGLVHRLAHAAAGDPSITLAERRAILEQAASIEARVPGWPTKGQVDA